MLSTKINTKGLIITDKEKYFTELARRLAAEGINAERATENSLAVFQNELPVVRIDTAGNPFRYTEDPDMRLAGGLYHHSVFTAKMVAEYVEAVEKPPALTADGLDKGFKLFCEMNRAVLAGKETSYGYQFVTWERSYGGTSVMQGHYYGENYTGAKEDFAVRAGLVNKNRLFTDEQLGAIHDALGTCLYEFYGDEKALVPIQRQIDRVLEDSGFKMEAGEKNMEMGM